VRHHGARVPREPDRSVRRFRTLRADDINENNSPSPYAVHRRPHNYRSFASQRTAARKKPRETGGEVVAVSRVSSGFIRQRRDAGTHRFVTFSTERRKVARCSLPTFALQEQSTGTVDTRAHRKDDRAANVVGKGHIPLHYLGRSDLDSVMEFRFNEKVQVRNNIHADIVH